MVDLITGSGDELPSEVRVYRGSTLNANPTNPTADQTFDPIGDTLLNGVFVG